MRPLPEQAHRRFPKQSTRLDELHERLLAAHVSGFAADEISPVAKIPLKSRAFFQAGARRVSELIDSFVRDVEEGVCVPLFVTSRALIETGALLFDVWRRIERLLEAPDEIDLSEFDEKVMNALLGCKAEDFGRPEFRAINVLTVIDRLSQETVPRLRGFYDGLSERAHPNFAGLFGPFHEVVEAPLGSRFIDRPITRWPELLEAPLDAAVAGVGLTVAAVESYERNSARFVELCERAIFEGGRWPQPIPYRWH